MNLPDFFNPTNQMISTLLKTNRKSKKYGLTLSPQATLEIIRERNNILQNCGRVELSTKITQKIIGRLCTSPYIDQENYPSTITDLHEIFYYIKTETQDEIADDELVDIIMNLYNDTCKGSIDLLSGRELEKLVREFKENKFHLQDTREEDNYE